VACLEGAAYGGFVPDDLDGNLAAARHALSAARAELDDAVAAVPEIDGQETIASPLLMALLFRAVKAKNHLDDVLSSGPAPKTIPTFQ
jgi:hypothetical protein